MWVQGWCGGGKKGQQQGLWRGQKVEARGGDTSRAGMMSDTQWSQTEANERLALQLDWLQRSVACRFR